MKRTTLTQAELLLCAEALTALAHGQPVQYYSPVCKAWCDCETVDTDFPHRPKPPEPLPEASTDVNDY